MIEVKFYNNQSENAEVKKIISHIETFNCEIYEDCSIQTPTIIVPMSDSLTWANYCYIEKFHRFYYIVSSTIYDGNLVRISLKCDVLMSFWNSFSKSKCIAKRSSSSFNTSIPDNFEVFSPQPEIKRTKDTNKFQPTSSGGCYILTIGGK